MFQDKMFDTLFYQGYCNTPRSEINHRGCFRLIKRGITVQNVNLSYLRLCVVNFGRS